MKLSHNSRRFIKSIAFRISGTCWVVTLLTLAVYVLVNLPQQKKDLQAALRSKAQGVSSSLQDVTAGAAMSEDYSTVVDHCIQVLRGDDAIEYLVITKTDGFSVIVERKGWRTENLDQFWRPSGKESVAEIAFVPLVGKTVFRYSRPFDYSGIRWGWVNVGLSTAAYDQSVTRVYERSALLAVVSAAMSLLISFAQARRLVQPIITLQNVVRQVAGGDLSARASLRSGDEVEELAKSFNAMADTILERNRILETVRFAGQQLLSADDWTCVVNEVLGKIRSAAGVSRAYVLQNSELSAVILSSKRYERVAAGITSTVESWQDFPWTGTRRSAWAEQLSRGDEVVVDLNDCDDGGLGQIDNSLSTIILVPIHDADSWWGLLGLDECTRGRQWGEAEKDSIRAIAGMFGAAITRQRAKQAILDARDNLEQRVLERTGELQAEIQAKQLANARLAEVQQHLMTLSRQAGMAEIATGVLHNVGNVLNSVNVSATIVANKTRESRVSNLLALTRMLQEHSTDLPEYLGQDPKGQRVVPYLGKLAAHFEDERQVILRELDLLTGHIGHIKEIVTTQQNYAKVSGLTEVVSLADLVEDAVQIVASGLDRHRIRLQRNFEPVKPVSVDKHLVLQILLNLLRNAKEAVKESKTSDPRILVRIYSVGEDRIRVSVTDSGIGLPPENLIRIFSHGFTTRPDGHGFGLHSGANAARQMNGALWAESDGPNRGATFILELPLMSREKSKGKQFV